MRSRLVTLCVLGAIGLCAGLVLHTALGTVWIPPRRVLAAVVNAPEDPVDRQIVWELRVPRGLLAVMVGAMLGLAGAVLQGVTRNRLADPALTGVSAGGVLVAVIVLTVPLGTRDPTAALPFVVLFGCLAGGATVFALSSVRDTTDPVRLVLTAIVVNAIVGSMTSILLLRDNRVLGSILPWLIGSLNGRVWSDVWMVVPWALVTLPCGLLLGRLVNAVQLDPALARSIGVDIRRGNAALFVVSALLAAGAVTAAGALGFVGLIVPNALRPVVGEDGRRLLPLSALYGAVLVVVADTVAQALTIKPPFPSSVQRPGLPVGAVLAVLGTTFLLVTLSAKRWRGATSR